MASEASPASHRVSGQASEVPSPKGRTQRRREKRVRQAERKRLEAFQEQERALERQEEPEEEECPPVTFNTEAPEFCPAPVSELWLPVATLWAKVDESMVCPAGVPTALWSQEDQQSWMMNQEWAISPVWTGVPILDPRWSPPASPVEDAKVEELPPPPDWEPGMRHLQENQIEDLVRNEIKQACLPEGKSLKDDDASE